MAIADTQTIGKELQEIIAGIVEIEPEKITLDANFVEDLGMDSMMALEILAGIEKKFKIQVPEEKLSSLTNLKEAINLTRVYLDKQ